MSDEAMLNDIGSLCRAVGEFDGARPESPHMVMLSCIDRIKIVRGELAAAVSIIPTGVAWKGGILIAAEEMTLDDRKRLLRHVVNANVVLGMQADAEGQG